MTRLSITLLLLALGLGLSACQSPDERGDTAKKPAAAAVVLTAPQDRRRQEWKPYLQQVISQHMEGVTDRVSRTTCPQQHRGRRRRPQLLRPPVRERDRGDLAHRAAGNMLAFGSPDSAKMGDLMLSAFSGAKPDALKGSQVLFIGKPEDSARVQALVEASGAKYIFVEAK
jgi:hypothetical protein